MSRDKRLLALEPIHQRDDVAERDARSESAVLTAAAPRELKAVRQAKRLDVSYVAERVGLDPTTVRAVEDGQLRAIEGLMVEWRRVLEAAPDHRPAAHPKGPESSRTAWAVLVWTGIAFIAAVFAAYLAF